MNSYEIMRWWWENNVDWIKIHDPWIIPLVAVSLPISFLLRTFIMLIKLWRGK